MTPVTTTTRRAKNVLFLCTGNSARSILAEALMQRLGPPLYHGFSAGSQPKSAPHPMAIAILRDKGYETSGFRSKGWDEFAGPDAPELDLIITVCDKAATESCPIWPGSPATAHWSLEDPAAIEGSIDAIRTGFARTYAELKRRIEGLVALDWSEFDLDEMRRVLNEIGKSESADPRY